MCISVSFPSSCSANSVELVSTACANSQGIKAIHAHAVHINIAWHVEAEDDDKVGENKDGSLEIVALSFTIYVRQQENTKNNGNHVPLREDQAVEISR